MITLGAQLYTVRDYIQTESDFDYSMKLISQMGYTTVQLSAMGPMKPEAVREICDKHGLKIILTHTAPDRILNDTENVIKEHEIYGSDYIGIGMMPQKYRSPEWLHRFAEDFKEPAKKIAAAGKLLMYHNHNLEFQKFGGKLIIDTLTESFAPDEMGFTVDTYWVQMGGADICGWLRKLQGRTPCVHLKDFAVRGMEPIMAPVLEGNIDFKKVMATMEELGGVKYAFVEQDICQGSPFDCLKTSYDNLSALGYK